MKSFLIVANHATNSVAASTAVDIRTPSLAINGIDVPSANFAIPAVLVMQLTTGATPGTYDLEIEQSAASDGTYTGVYVLDEVIGGTATGAVLFANVTLDSSKPFVRVNVSDATANAGTITANLLIG